MAEREWKNIDEILMVLLAGFEPTTTNKLKI